MSSISNPPMVPAAFEQALKTATVRWVIPGWLFIGEANQLMVLGRIYYIPIFVPVRTIYDRIGVRVAIGDGIGGLANLRIYRWSGGLPATLVLDAGNVSTNAAGAQEIVISETLERGYYFLAVRCDQAPELRGPTGAQTSAPISGLSLDQATAIILGLPSVDGAMADPALAPTATEVIDRCVVRLREA